jgi:hypothetical protein
MFKKTVLAASAALFLAAGPAFAFQCPSDVAKIDEALAGNPDLSAEQLAEVKELRDKGEELHQAGSHQESVDTLAQAKEILGIE